jgi:hypothetical protein
MASKPSIVTRTAQPYVAIAGTVTMGDIIARVPDVFGWLAGRAGHRAGRPAVLRYNVVDMPRSLEMEVGVPVADVPTAPPRSSPAHCPKAAT